MWTQFFLSIFAIGGATVLWRNWVADHPKFKQWLKDHLKGFQQMVLCGSCFTYWLTLVYLVLFNPLADWSPITRFDLPIVNEFFIFLMTWMAISWGALICRFGYVLLQESVNYFVHQLSDHGH